MAMAACRVRSPVPRAVEGEQVAAGWLPWLVSVAAEAVRGWVLVCRVVREARQGHTLSSPLSLSLHLHFGSVHFLLSSLISNLEHWNGENLEQCGLRIPPFGFLFLVENIN